jgi:type IV pilus assembly protein PilC
MAIFEYKAQNSEGRIIQDRIQAENIEAARRMLKQRNYFVVDVRPQGTGLNASIPSPNDLIGPSKKDVAIFSRQLAVMLNAGVPLVQALANLQRQVGNKKFAKIIKDVRAAVESGTNFADALSKYPRTFTPLFVNMVRAGETSGSLDRSLERMADTLEDEQALAGKVRGALAYPVIVLIIAILIVYFLFTMVVPQFTEVLVGMGAKLPWITVFMMDVSKYMQEWGLLTLAVLFGFIILFNIFSITKTGRRILDPIKLRVPGFGNLIKKTSLAGFARSFSTLIGGGVNVIESLDITAGSASNYAIEQVIRKTKDNVMVGEPIYASFQLYPKIFPDMVISMTAIGEETGALDDMMDKVADYYEREVSEAVDILTAMIQPIMILFVGGAVALVVFGMFLPLTDMIGALSRGI